MTWGNTPIQFQIASGKPLGNGDASAVTGDNAEITITQFNKATFDQQALKASGEAQQNILKKKLQSTKDRPAVIFNILNNSIDENVALFFLLYTSPFTDQQKNQYLLKRRTHDELEKYMTKVESELKAIDFTQTTRALEKLEQASKNISEAYPKDIL